MQRPDDPVLAWVELGEQANEAFHLGDLEGARRCWRDSHRLAEAEFSPSHPLLAASFCNFACVCRIDGDHRDGVRHGRRSIELWEAAEAWVRDMRLESPSRSSAFHLRLRARHRETYDRPRLEKCRALLALGRTTAMNNLAGVFYAAGEIEESRALYSRALSEREVAVQAAQVADTVVDVIRRNVAAAGGEAGGEALDGEAELRDRGETFTQLARRRRWLVDLPPVLTDEGALMASVLMPRALDCRGL